MNGGGEQAWIGLGGNLGDVPATLSRAREALAGLAMAGGAGGSLRSSRLFGSSPWGPVPGPDYVNQVVGLTTLLAPEALLAALLSVETSLGRVRTIRWGPRTLDLDLLAYGARVMSTPALELPHPRLAERRFVLLPWSEVAPDFPVPPHGRTVAALLAACPDGGRVWPLP